MTEKIEVERSLIVSLVVIILILYVFSLYARYEYMELENEYYSDKADELCQEMTYETTEEIIIQTDDFDCIYEQKRVCHWECCIPMEVKIKDDCMMQYDVIYDCTTINSTCMDECMIYYEEKNCPLINETRQKVIHKNYSTGRYTDGKIEPIECLDFDEQGKEVLITPLPTNCRTFDTISCGYSIECEDKEVGFRATILHSQTFTLEEMGL